MTVITSLDWDGWRNAYPTLTYPEQQAFHSQIYEQYPTQRHYDERYVAQTIEQTNPRTVIELGGWDGELANLMLNRYPITDWTNIELCTEAAQAGQDRHPCYHAPTLDDWYWTQGPWHADLFVASHSIEHLSIEHFNQTIASTKTRAIFLDAPLEDHALNWRGFTGTHILQTGWTGITEICTGHGYRLAWAQDHGTDPSSGGKARACLYLAEEGGPDHHQPPHTASPRYLVAKNNPDLGVSSDVA